MTATRLKTLARRLSVAAGILAGLCAFMATRSSAESVSDYARRLESASDSVRTAVSREREKPGSSQALLDKLYESTPAKVDVQAADGSTIKADLSWLRADVRKLRSAGSKGRAEALERLAARIDAAHSAAGDQTSVTPAKRNRADAKLKGVLAGSEYQISKVEEGFWSRVNQAIWGFLGRLFDLPSSIAGGIGWVVLALIVIGFAATLVFLVLRLVAYYSYPTSKTESATSTRVTTKKTPAPNSAVQAAEELAAAGQYREAFRSIYLAAILVLDKAKLIRYADGTTNWEYLKALTRQPDEQPVKVFREMTSSFDELIYGKQEVSSQDYAASTEHLKQLEEVL